MADPAHTPALEIRGLSKSFAGVPVLRSVDLTVQRGEIHGLIGPNGSGKSTLVKVLSGFHRPDGSPSVSINGRELSSPFSVADVRAAGVGFVHQDLALIGASSAADNLGFSAAGFKTGRGGRIRWREHASRARRLFERVGLDIDPFTPVAELGPAQRTLVAIARALGEFDEESVLVLDEPTAALPHQEVDTLFAALRRLADGGTALIYISHRLPELTRLTDRVTVLRDGRVIAVRETASTSQQDLALLMLGEVETAAPATAEPEGDRPERELLRLTSVECQGLAPTTLTVRSGEIVALTGSVGSGAAEVGRMLYGITPVGAGSIELAGEPFDPARGPREAKRRGIAYLPADRAGESSFQELTMGENVLVADLASVSRGGRVVASAARAEVDRLIADFDVRPPERERVLRTLSGGNQQKALLAKWLRLGPRLLVLDEPTQGIDIRTRGEIYERLRAAARDGLAVLWITSDFEEASVIADRVGVFVQGRLTELLAADRASPERLGRLSLGVAA